MRRRRVQSIAFKPKVVFDIAKNAYAGELLNDAVSAVKIVPAGLSESGTRGCCFYKAMSRFPHAAQNDILNTTYLISRRIGRTVPASSHAEMKA